MENTKGNKNQNNFNGTTNFNGPVQFAAGDINNGDSVAEKNIAQYTAEPIWRSPITMAILTWISVVIGIASLLPFGHIIKNVLELLKGNVKMLSSEEIQIYSIVFMVLFCLFIIIFSLRRITKKQTRHPICFNYAISGYGGRLNLERIHIDKCPLCGGKMKYYNKPIEWREIVKSNGSTKREVIKRVPALECKRNARHWFEVDPAEDKIG